MLLLSDNADNEKYEVVDIEDQAATSDKEEEQLNTVATASEYLVITGCYIDDIKLAKKAWILPGQQCTTFDVSPVNYTFEVHAMSAEKLSFLLPAVFTIGPRVDDFDSLLRYAKLLSNHDRHSNDVRELVQGIIEGETRVLAAGMTMEEVFRGTKEFKKEVFDKAKNLGCQKSSKRQTVQNAKKCQAKIDVAEAKMKGSVGAKLREGQTVQNAAKIDAETKIVAVKRDGESRQEEINVSTKVKIFENQREAEIAEANAELATKKANWARDTKMAEVEASKAVTLKETELQREVELKNALTQTEKLRAQNLSKATVDNEIKAQEAKWELFKKQRVADSILYEQEKQAEGSLYSKTREAEAVRNQAEASLFAMKQKAEGEQYAKFKEVEGNLYAKSKEAEGSLYSTTREAEALKEKSEASLFVAKQKAEGKLYAKIKVAEGDLYAKIKEAEGLRAFADAQGFYVKTLMDSFGGNYTAMRDYLMINNGLFENIARINSDAVRGLEPKISIWTNGGESLEGGSGGVNSAMKEIAGVYRMLPPLFSTVHEQTGMTPPAWMGTITDGSQ
ncbi:hypothetical protein GIB67_035916 [Kingdonia uniflora]|uniref:Flotillin-like n=1 Tax=Kingdonia uniflora TaxID=39325 RepID=A0A7J7N0K7_9MAGN|nr:hypothetical protein GIB67_035916 [Kingdonia uniflora]